jgi:hypothetical protein
MAGTLTEPVAQGTEVSPAAFLISAPGSFNNLINLSLMEAQ